MFNTFSKIIYFITCLIATSLPITGIFIWINKMKKKKDDIYTPLKETSCTINKKYEEYITSLVKLEEERIEYNKKASETDSIVEVLDDINADIAYYDIIDIYKQYKKCLVEEKDAKDKLKKLSEELKKREDLLQSYKEKKRDAKSNLARY